MIKPFDFHPPDTYQENFAPPTQPKEKQRRAKSIPGLHTRIQRRAVRDFDFCCRGAKESLMMKKFHGVSNRLF